MARTPQHPEIREASCPCGDPRPRRAWRGPPPAPSTTRWPSACLVGCSRPCVTGSAHHEQQSTRRHPRRSLRAARLLVRGGVPGAEELAELNGELSVSTFAAVADAEVRSSNPSEGEEEQMRFARPAARRDGVGACVGDGESLVRQTRGNSASSSPDLKIDLTMRMRPRSAPRREVAWSTSFASWP
jgi:hypothetical protein